MPDFNHSSLNRLRILQLFSRYKEYGGEEGSVFRIGDALSENFDVGVFLSSSKEVFSGGVFQKGMGALKAVSNWTLIGQLRRYQKVGRYNGWIIHNVFPAMSPSVYSLAFELGVPVIHYLHNYRMGCVNGFFLNHGEPCQRCMDGNFLPAFQTACWHGSHLQSGMMGAIIRRARNMGLLHRVQRWVAISEAQKLEHVAMGIPSERISVIHHFLEPKQEPPAYPKQGDVICVGRLSPEKGVDRLLRAWKYLQGSGRILWIVGDGPDRGKLEMMVKELSLQNVRFTGFLEHHDIQKIWENVACSATPSIWKEPFGMVILEAWAKQRPVVAHRIGALPELIDEGINGSLVTPEDPQEMAEAIRAILENPDHGADMGKNGFAKLRKEFTKERWSQKMCDLVENTFQTHP